MAAANRYEMISGPIKITNSNGDHTLDEVNQFLERLASNGYEFHSWVVPPPLTTNSFSDAREWSNKSCTITAMVINRLKS